MGVFYLCTITVQIILAMVNQRIVKNGFCGKRTLSVESYFVFDILWICRYIMFVNYT